MSFRPLTLVALAAAMSFAHSSSGRAQSLPPQLSHAGRDTLQRLVDSARAARLPWELLTAKAAEGVLKGADEPRIIRAVRQLTGELGAAISILPANAPTGVVSAAASALHSGASRAELQKLTALHLGEQDLAVALVALADLMANHVPSDLAASSIEELVKRRASEADFSAFRASVARDIANGQPPSAAVNSGVRDAVRTLDGHSTVAPISRPVGKPPSI
jgi:hypothetical protein